MSKLSTLVAGAGLFVAGCLPAQGFPADGTRVVPVVPKTVIFSPMVTNAFQFQYDLVTIRAGVEAGFCLYGRDKRDSVFVDRAEFPFVHEADSHHILMTCRQDSNFLGLAHTHNYTREYNQPCAHSPVDAAGFLGSKIGLSTVYCGEGRVSNMVRGRER
jgi:hypothetical protein